MTQVVRDKEATDADRRSQNLLSGLAELSGRIRRGHLDGERLLFLLGAMAVPLGIFLIGIGWYGAAGSGLVFEQIPYLLSCGLLGIGSIVIGCTLYACWWITRSVREQRERHDELLRKQDEAIAAMKEIGEELRRVRGRA